MEHKSSRKLHHNGQRSKKPYSKESKKLARAGRTKAANIPNNAESRHSQQKSDYSGSELKVHASHAATFERANSASVDANLDSGCSISMTPFSSSIKQISPENTPVQLADHSLMKSTHRGSWKLPLQVDKEIKTLIVPLLHKPLLSIAGICDLGLTVVFTLKNCRIYQKADVMIDQRARGEGYQRGNLFYLPSGPHLNALRGFFAAIKSIRLQWMSWRYNNAQSAFNEKWEGPLSSPVVHIALPFLVKLSTPMWGLLRFRQEKAINTFSCL